MKKKLEINAKTVATAVGTAIAVGSMVAIADFIDRKARASRTAHTAELVLGVTGLLIGAGLTLGANRPPRHKIIVEDMFDEDELELANEQIRETLNTGADRGIFTTEASNTKPIEVDEEATIEDFI